MLRTAFPAIFLAIVSAACTQQPALPGPNAGSAGGEYLLVFEQEFRSQAAKDQFHYSDPRTWFWSPVGRGALELFGESRYRPPHRSPLKIALVKDMEFRDFVLEAEVRQSGREYGHRDLCLFFGFEAPDRFYYAHLATAPDERAHNLFIVNRADRANLLPARERGVDWGENQWHTLRLERNTETGLVRVFFDDMEAPVLEAHDTGIAWGRVGFGSFDDSGLLRRLRIWAPEHRVVTGTPSPFPEL